MSDTQFVRVVYTVDYTLDNPGINVKAVLEATDTMAWKLAYATFREEYGELFDKKRTVHEVKDTYGTCRSTTWWLETGTFQLMAIAKPVRDGI